MKAYQRATILNSSRYTITESQYEVINHLIIQIINARVNGCFTICQTRSERGSSGQAALASLGFIRRLIFLARLGGAVFSESEVEGGGGRGAGVLGRVLRAQGLSPARGRAPPATDLYLQQTPRSRLLFAAAGSSSGLFFAAWSNGQMWTESYPRKEVTFVWSCL